jgi:peroxiredoxin/outer membrane lipoprotein-sorting protein
VKQLLIFSLLLLCLSGYGPAAAEAPAPEELLLRVSEVYRNLKSYRFEGSVLREKKGEGYFERREIPVLKMGAPPDQIRSETGWPGRKLVIVQNREKSSVYLSRTRQFTQGDQAEVKSRMAEISGSMDSAMASLVASTYSTLAEWGRPVGSITEDTLEVDGKPVVCWVLEVEETSPKIRPGFLAPMPRKFWIDRERLIILKEVSPMRYKTGPSEPFLDAAEITLLKSAQINLPLASDTFSLSPPEGSLPWSTSTLADLRRAGLKGEEAPDFTLKNFKGKPFALKQLRGKIVLLNFWATWCRPCRFEMPILQNVYKEFQEKGLEVLAINDEDPQASQRFLEENGITFPALTDTEGVMQIYQIRAIPTMILLDRNGKVSWQNVGASSENVLRKALAEAGLE